MAEIRINATGGVKLYDADDSHYAQIVAGTITSNVDAITLGHDTVTIADNLSLGSDSSVLKFGADGDTTLTHTDGTGLTLNSTNKLCFQDTGTYIGSNADGDIDVVSDGTAVDSINLESAGGVTLDAGSTTHGITYEDDGTAMLRITNSSSDVIIKPLVDAKDIIFQQYDGTEVARIEDNATFNVSSAGKFAYAGTAVTATAAEMNLLDGGTSVGSSITLADADGFIVNDGGTMKTIPASDISSYAGGNLVLLGRSVNDDSGTAGGIQFNGIFTSTYRNYLLLIGKVAVETDTADLRVVLLDASNNALTGNHYDSGGEYNDAGDNSVDELRAVGTANWIIGPSGNNGDVTPTHGSFHIFNNSHTTTNDRVFMTGTGLWHHSTNHDPRMFYFGGGYANAVHAAGIRVETSTGNISDHEISIFGIKAY